jgi:isoquinoline 1-oxidoreductase beta subunit
MTVNRRRFLTWTAGGAFLMALPDQAAAADGASGPLSPWIAIHPDGRVVLTVTAFEMGQGSRTGQVQLLADELDAAWDSISTVQATETAPYTLEDALYSGGSDTIKPRFDTLRRAGATARSQLVAAAARRWGVSPTDCVTEPGLVRHPLTDRRLAYGVLAAEAATLPAPADPPLKAAADRRYIGKPMSTLDLADKVTGQATYGIDLRLPGMLYASLRRAPSFGGTLASVDEAPALATPGVVKVVRLKDGVAVVARSTWAAFKGVRALDPVWTEPAVRHDSADISAALAAGQAAPDALVRPRDTGVAMRAELRAAFAAAPRKVEATWEIPYLAHCPMEPLNATAHWRNGRPTVWAPCQSPTFARNDVTAITGLKKDEYDFVPMLIGGGFGRRLKGDYMGYAIAVARDFDVPVQLVWTREEDFTHDFYRPVLRATFRAPLEPDGTIRGYEVLAATADDYTGGSAPAPYAMPRYAATLARVPAGVPVGAWRAVDPGMILFAKESFLDECAHAAGTDPLAWREAHLAGNTRALRVLRAATTALGWSTLLRPGHGRGVALLHEWDTLVAHAIEVSVTGRTLRVEQIAVAADVGTAVNPDQVRAQFEGGTLMGLSAALGEQITVTGGRADQTNFDSYRVIRMNQAPPIQVILFDSPGEAVGGVGEPPVPGVAPALANAVFAATGRRVRTLPFSLAFDV